MVGKVAERLGRFNQGREPFVSVPDTGFGNGARDLAYAENTYWDYPFISLGTPNANAHQAGIDVHMLSGRLVNWLQFLSGQVELKKNQLARVRVRW